MGRPVGSKNKRTLATEAAAAILLSSDAKPLDYMLAIMRDPAIPSDLRFEAAKAAAPYCHPRLDKVMASKRETSAQDSKEAAVGMYAPASAPKLIVNNR